MLIDLLIMDKRSELMPLVLDKICGLYYQIHNIELFTIASSDSLSESQVKDIEQFLAQCTGHVILSHRIIDTDLIAGIRLQSATSLWEHSIRRQLAHVQQLFMR
jgi:F0F1-type ATP synthase delta subunit